MMARATRRTVRIVKPRTASRPAMVSLLATLSAAVVLFVVWRVWEEEEPLVVEARGVRDVTLNWRCEQGHVFLEIGQAGSRRCPQCGTSAYPVDTYECEVHGAYLVEIRLGQRADGSTEPVERRVAGEEAWLPVDQRLPCPRCERELKRVKRDPFSQLPRARPKTAP